MSTNQIQLEFVELLIVTPALQEMWSYIDSGSEIRISCLSVKVADQNRFPLPFAKGLTSL